MGIPTSLGGITSFVIAIIFIIGMSATDIFPDQSKQLKDSELDFANALNRSVAPTNTTTEVGFVKNLLGAVGIDGIYDFIRNFLSLLIAFIVMNIQAIFLFIGIAAILPTEFYLLFAIVLSTMLVAIVKLIFFSGD